MKISPLSDVMGAEVTGVDLNNLTASDRAALNQALLEHLVLCVRGQRFDDMGAFLDGARNFGVPKVQHLESYRSDKHPEGGVITSEDRDVKDGKRIIRGTLFHTDETFIAEPPKATVVYAVAIPGKGGNTRYVNMCRAYETLDEATKRKIDGLVAVHYYGKQRPGRKVPSLTDEQLRNTPPVQHPVVRTNEETGRKALFVHEAMTDYIVGMDPAESEALLKRLYEHSTQNPALQYSHAWRTGDFVIWDDRATLHAATADYAENEKRLMYRTMIKGSATH
ncbi:TauD/TfdA family dioxygenase [Pigmentiphaga soli]|uniref:TauD/TfdA family dioxygenase n=1 Tax=Pigmentiphaga soli TaxID=1007095 RepID=A0ABP8GLS7_9BURK